MAQNQDFHILEGRSPDWIELYNHSFIPAYLEGWALQQIAPDGTTNRWAFTNVQIAPYGHLVIYCDNQPFTNAVLTAPFQLSAEGENISLLAPNGAVIDRVVFPALPTDVSYARFSDGARFFSFNAAPTIGRPNRLPPNLNPRAERKDPFVGPGGTVFGLNARVFDDIGISYAAVCFRKAGQKDFQELPLFDDGRHGDKRAGDGYMGALLPEVAANDTIEFYIRAIDLEGESGTSPDDISAELHRVIVPAQYGALRLTEVVAANNSGLRDERNQFEDWIELLNTGSEPVSLKGVALTKDYFDRENVWLFPTNGVIQPNQRLIIFCDDDRTHGPLHATFTLNRTGDRIFLVEEATWTILDSISFEALPENASYGVLGHGAEAQLLAWPTPGDPNQPLNGGGEQLNVVTSRLLRPVNGTAQLQLRWLTDASAVYRVEHSSDLRTWSPAIELPLDLGEGLNEWTGATSGNSGFYRIVITPR
jgi:hypothetical protein